MKLMHSMMRKHEINRIPRENGLDAVIWVKNRKEERTFSKGQKKD